MTFTVRSVMDKEDVPRWKQTGTELLVFLLESDRATWYFLSDCEKVRIRHYSLTPRYTGEFFAILELAHPEQTRAAAGAAILQSHAVRRFRDAETIDRIVPVDRRLEEEARAWVRSEDAFIRLERAKALQYFRSNENILILKSLLDDPAWSMLHKHIGEERVTLGREYFVRKAAFESLKTMQVDVEPPVLLQPESDRVP